jgi:serine phosphatase RsbU (regulator of sigma subunit)
MHKANAFLKNALIIVLTFCSLLSFAQQLQENLAKEIEGYLTEAKKLEESGDLNQAAFNLNKAATVYWVNGVPKKAVELFEKTIALNKRIGNLNAQRTLYNNIGMIYTDEENFPKALENFNKSLDIARQMNRKPDIAAALINMANVQSEWGKHHDSAKTLEEAHMLARELNDEKLLRNCYSLLTDVYEKLGNSEKSSEYFSLFTAISQKIQRDEMRKRDAETRQIVDQAKSKVSEIEQIKQATEEELKDKQRALHETEVSLQQVEQISREREMQIDLLNKEKELQDAIIKNQRLVRNVFIFIIFVVMAFAILFLYNLNVKKKANQMLSKQNKEIAEQKDLIELVNKDLGIAFNRIEKQNRDITSSINYAQRIQEALLPDPCTLQSIIPDSFVYFKPRDIVSGDFYWYTGYSSPQALEEKNRNNFIKVHNIKNDETGFLISAVDCTGHGVPGAFMSMIGFNLLETITRNGIILPDMILNRMHKVIRNLLRQDTTDNRDGMDMAICSVIDKGRRVLFAGAKNPLIFFVDGELNYIKGDGFPVGGMEKGDKRLFTLHSINVEKPTTFYIFSDGYTDQFGGDSGKKFGTRSFKELLLEIHHLPMAEQVPILEEKMKSWIGQKFKQIDDNIIIGFRVIPGEIDL